MEKRAVIRNTDAIKQPRAAQESGPRERLGPGGGSMEGQSPAKPRPITLSRAILLAPFRPATVGERTAEISLKSAWLVHIGSAAVIFTMLSLLVLWARWPGSTINWAAEIVSQVQTAIGFLMSELRRYPLESVLAVVGMIVLIEGGHLAGALLLMPWGARDEPLRKSFGSALRQTWLSSTQLVLAVLIVGGATAWIEREDQQWRKAYAGPRSPTNLKLPARPTVPETDPGYDEAMTAYDAAVADYRRKMTPVWNAQQWWLQRRPWYVRWSELIRPPLGMLTGLWYLWVLLASIGAARDVPPIIREQRCIECGYNLHTIPITGRCPECGQPVAESLGPHVHPGAPWDHRKPGGAMDAAWESWTGVVVDPKAFGRLLRVSQGGTSHRLFFGMHLPAIGLAGAGTFVTGILVFEGPDTLLRDPEVVLVVVLIGCLCIAGAVGITCGGALLVGMIQSLTYGRNLLPAAMQVASYLGGFLLLWELLGGALILALVWLADGHLLNSLARGIGIDEGVLAGFLICVANFCCAGFFLHRLSVATAATRYANK